VRIFPRGKKYILLKILHGRNSFYSLKKKMTDNDPTAITTKTEYYSDATLKAWIEGHQNVIPNILQHNSPKKVSDRLNYLMIKTRDFRVPPAAATAVPPSKQQQQRKSIPITVSKTLNTKQKKWLNELKLLRLLENYNKNKTEHVSADLVVKMVMLKFKSSIYRSLTEQKKHKANNDLVEALLLYEDYKKNEKMNKN